MRKKTLTLLMVVALVGAALSLAQADVVQSETSITANSAVDWSQLGPRRTRIQAFTAVISHGDLSFGPLNQRYSDAGLQMQSGLSSARLSAYDGSTPLRSVTENGVGDQNDTGSPGFISRQGLSGNDGTDAVFGVIGFNNALVNALHLSAIPEPASLFLIGAGLLGIAGISRLKFGRK